MKSYHQRLFIMVLCFLTVSIAVCATVGRADEHGTVVFVKDQQGKNTDVTATLGDLVVRRQGANKPVASTKGGQSLSMKQVPMAISAPGIPLPNEFVIISSSSPGCITYYLNGQAYYRCYP